MLDELLLHGAILRDRQRFYPGPELALQRPKRIDRQILELIGRDVDLSAELLQRRTIVVGGPREFRRDVRRARMLMTLKFVKPQ